METIESTVFIKRPPQEVFDFVNNPAKTTRWQSQIVSAEWISDGPPGVGSKNRTVSRLLGREVETVGEITVWDPPNQVSFRVTEGPFPIEGTSTFEARENGTLITLHVSGETRGFFKLADRLVAKQLKKQIDTNYSALKLLLEAG